VKKLLGGLESKNVSANWAVAQAYERERLCRPCIRHCELCVSIVSRTKLPLPYYSCCWESMTPSNCETTFRFLIVYTPSKAKHQQSNLHQSLTSEGLHMNSAATKISVRFSVSHYLVAVQGEIPTIKVKPSAYKRRLTNHQ
jgi:hypothetical protein